MQTRQRFVILIDGRFLAFEPENVACFLSNQAPDLIKSGFLLFSVQADGDETTMSPLRLVGGTVIPNKSETLRIDEEIEFTRVIEVSEREYA